MALQSDFRIENEKVLSTSRVGNYIYEVVAVPRHNEHGNHLRESDHIPVKKTQGSPRVYSPARSLSPPQALISGKQLLPKASRGSEDTQANCNSPSKLARPTAAASNLLSKFSSVPLQISSHLTDSSRNMLTIGSYQIVSLPSKQTGSGHQSIGQSQVAVSTSPFGSSSSLAAFRTSTSTSQFTRTTTTTRLVTGTAASAATAPQLTPSSDGSPHLVALPERLSAAATPQVVSHSQGKAVAVPGRAQHLSLNMPQPGARRMQESASPNYAIPPHLMGRSLDNPMEDSSGRGRRPQKPRLGVRIPYRNLTSQIVTQEEIAQELLQRSLKRNPVTPEGNDYYFALKLTHRLANRITPSGQPDGGAMKIHSSLLNSGFHQGLLDGQETYIPLSMIPDPLAAPDMDTLYSDQLWRDGQFELDMTHHYGTPQKLDPEMEKELALKQLMELPKRQPKTARREGAVKRVPRRAKKDGTENGENGVDGKTEGDKSALNATEDQPKVKRKRSDQKRKVDTAEKKTKAKGAKKNVPSASENGIPGTEGEGEVKLSNGDAHPQRKIPKRSPSTKKLGPEKDAATQETDAAGTETAKGKKKQGATNLKMQNEKEKVLGTQRRRRLLFAAAKKDAEVRESKEQAAGVQKPEGGRKIVKGRGVKRKIDASVDDEDKVTGIDAKEASIEENQVNGSSEMKAGNVRVATRNVMANRTNQFAENSKPADLPTRVARRKKDDDTNVTRCNTLRSQRIMRVSKVSAKVSSNDTAVSSNAQQNSIKPPVLVQGENATRKELMGKASAEVTNEGGGQAAKEQKVNRSPTRLPNVTSKQVNGQAEESVTTTVQHSTSNKEDVLTQENSDKRADVFKSIITFNSSHKTTPSVSSFETFDASASEDSTKRRRTKMRELDTLFIDEGAVNLLLDGSQRVRRSTSSLSKPGAKWALGRQVRHQNQQELNLKSRLVKNAVMRLSTTTVPRQLSTRANRRVASTQRYPIMEQNQTSTKLTDFAETKLAEFGEEDKSPPSITPIDSPSPSQSFVFPSRLPAEASRIIHRHSSSSSFSSRSTSPTRRPSFDNERPSTSRSGAYGQQLKINVDTLHGSTLSGLHMELAGKLKDLNSKSAFVMKKPRKMSLLKDKKKKEGVTKMMPYGTASSSDHSPEKLLELRCKELGISTKLAKKAIFDKKRNFGNQPALQKKISAAVKMKLKTEMSKNFRKGLLLGTMAKKGQKVKKSKDDAASGAQETSPLWIGVENTNDDAQSSSLNVDPKAKKKGSSLGVTPSPSRGSKSPTPIRHPTKKDAKMVAPLSPNAASYSNLVKTLENENLKKRKGLEGEEFAKQRSSIRQCAGTFIYRDINLRRYENLVQIILTPASTKMKNSFNVQVLRELREALHQCRKDETCRVVLLSSTGSSFCQGIDLHQLLYNNTDKRRKAAQELAQAVKEFIKALAMFNKPLVAGVHGAAIGLGVTMLPFFDMVYASDKATFYAPYAKLGQVPEGAATLTLPHMLGNAATSELLFACRKLTASEALNFGLVTRILWPARFQEELIPTVRSMASQSSQAMQATKALLRHSLRAKLDAALESESHLLIQHWCSPECQRSFRRLLETEDLGLQRQRLDA